MSSDVTTHLHEAIKKQLHQTDYDVVGIVPIPAHSDKAVRMRTLQEMIDDFEEFRGTDTIHYLLQIRPRKQSLETSTKSELNQAKLTHENIYLPNGKLNITYLLRNAEMLYDVRDYSLAKNIYKTILKSGENSSIAFFGLGKCLEAEGKLDEAHSHYEESIAFQPSIEAYQKLASIYLRQNKDQDAAEILERAVHMKEVNASVRFELYKAIGNCWTRAKKSESAEKYFKKALEINPTADEIRANLGALYLQNNRIMEAKRHFRDAIASNPRNHQAIAGLGSCSLAEDDKKSAHDLFAQALEIEINNPTAIFYLVKCAYDLKIYSVAVRLLEEYIEIAPINPNLLYSLAGLQFHLGRIEDARTVTQKILEIQPQHAGAKDLSKLIDKYTGSSSI